MKKGFFITIIMSFILFFVLITLYGFLSGQLTENSVTNGFYNVFNSSVHFDLASMMNDLANSKGLIPFEFSQVQNLFKQVIDSNIIKSGGISSLISILSGHANGFQWFSLLSGVGFICDTIITPTMIIIPVLVFLFWLCNAIMGFIGIIFNVLFSGAYWVVF